MLLIMFEEVKLEAITSTILFFFLITANRKFCFILSQVNLPELKFHMLQNFLLP